MIKLNNLWTSIAKPIFRRWSRGQFPLITFKSQIFKIDQLLDNWWRHKRTLGSNLPNAAKTQLQTLVNAGMTTSNSIVSFFNNIYNPLSSFWTKIRQKLRAYPGISITKPITILNANTRNSRGVFTINSLFAEKNSWYIHFVNNLSIRGKLELQLLFNAKVTDVELETALTKRNNDKLDALWTALKKDTNLGGYTGFNPGDTNITIDRKPYKLHFLITSLRNSDLDSTAGSALTPEQGKTELQALVNGGITVASKVRTALDTANTANNRALDTLWTALKTALADYAGHTFTTPIDISGSSYTINLLITNKVLATAGHSLADPIKVQLQALVDGGVAATDVRSALDTANTVNNRALDTLWSGLKTALADYNGHTFTTAIDISGSDYTIDLLITNKADPLSGSTLTSAKGQEQLQKLVNGGITDANVVRTALNTANNNRNLDILWTALKANTGLGNYAGFNFEDVDVDVGGTNYRLNLLIDHKADPLTGSTLTPEKGKAQLQALVDGGAAATDVRSALDTANAVNNRALDALWSGLKTALADYNGHTFTTAIDISGSDYTINLLITNKADPLSGSTLTSAKGQEQLQKLVNGGITDANVVRTALNTANNNRNLDNLWTALKANTGLGNYAGFNFEDVDVEVGGTNYRLNLLIDHKADPLTGSTLTPEKGKAQLQALVDGGVAATDVRSALDTANTVNNRALDTLWTALKANTGLGNYAGFNFEDVDVEVGGNNYRLNLLIDNKADPLSGSTLTPEKGKAQLQALVDGGVAATDVRSALDTANAVNNRALDALWSGLKTALTGYTGHTFTTPIDISGSDYTINLLITNKADPLSGSTLTSAKGQVQLQKLVNGGITDANAVRTALNTANNNRNLDNLWTALKANTGLGNYAGFNFEDVDVEVGGTNYRLNLLIDNKADPLSGSTLTPEKGKAQLQALVDGGVAATDVRSALDTANAVNNRALDALWSGLKTALTGYTGHTFTTPIDISGSDYTINLLITNKADPLSGSTLTSAKGQVQLQKLVNGGITDANAVRTALNTANNNRNLDNLWTALKANTGLGNYAGFNFEDVDVDVGGTNYRLNLLIDNKADPLSGSTLTPEKGKAQLQALVDGGVAATDVRSALDTANAVNNRALDALWSGLKTALTGYTGHTFTTPIDISGSDYTINLLITNKADPLSGSTLTSAKGQEQLQKLVNGGITDANVVRTALDTANNNRNLDILWTALKANTGLGNYAGFNFEDVDVDVGGTNYRLNLLIDHKADPLSGSTLTPEKGKAQLQALVNGGITDANAVRTALNTANNTALNTLWRDLKTALVGYTGHRFTSPITIDDNPYTLNLLIRNKGESVTGSNLTPEQGKVQLQTLVNGGVTDANKVRTALNTADNNKKLDDLWIEIVELFNQKGIYFLNNEIIIKDKSYPFDLIGYALPDTTKQTSSGSSLETVVKEQLQNLVNDGITAKDIETYSDNLEKAKTEKEEADEAESKKKQNLAIGLGTAGGVIALAGATGFAYWFLKIRKS